MLDEVTLDQLRDGLSHPDPTVRAQSADALAAVHDEKGLRRALSSPDRHVRYRALLAFCESRGRRLGWDLVRATCDVDPSVRTAAADISGRANTWISLWSLHRLARDAALQVRHHAALALAQRGGSTARHVLRRRAAHESDPALREVIAALVQRPRC
jgi:HEAT repeat protein